MRSSPLIRHRCKGWYSRLGVFGFPKTMAMERENEKGNTEHTNHSTPQSLIQSDLRTSKNQEKLRVNPPHLGREDFEWRRGRGRRYAFVRRGEKGTSRGSPETVRKTEESVPNGGPPKKIEDFQTLCALALRKFLPPTQNCFSYPELARMIRRCDPSFHPRQYGMEQFRELTSTCKFIAKIRGLLQIIRDSTKPHAPIITDNHTWLYVEDLSPLAQRRRVRSKEWGKVDVEKMFRRRKTFVEAEQEGEVFSIRTGFADNYDPTPESMSRQAKKWLRDI